MKINKILINNCGLLLLLTLLGGAVSAWLMQEFVWDLANYHYYNPWALLNGRLGYDIAPGNINTYFNPLLDFPTYFFIEWFNDTPRLVYFCQGLWYGPFLLLIYKTAQLFFATRWQALAAMLLAGTGFAAFYQLGTSTGEIPLAIFVLGGFYLLAKDRESPRRLLAAGLVLGLGLGLKPTALPYCLASGLALMFSYRRVDRRIILFALGGLAGYLLTNGWWLWTLWREFDNPVFPFLNGVFKSEWAGAVNFRDETHLPDTWGKWLFYPFYGNDFAGIDRLVPDFFDVRFALAFVLAAAWLPLRKKLPLDERTKFLAVWLLSAYVIWLALFSIFRYAVPMEALLSIFLVKWGTPLVRSRSAPKMALAVVAAYIFLSVPAHVYVKGPYDPAKKVLWIEPVPLRDGTLLILGAPQTSWLIPLLGKDAAVRAAYVQYNFKINGAQLLEQGKIPKVRDKLIAGHTGDKAYILYGHKGFLEQTLSESLKGRLYCSMLRNSLLDRRLFVCYERDKDKDKEKADGE